METRRRNQTITRYRPPGIVPLELWDLLVDGQILWETMAESEFPEILCRVIEALRQGIGETRSEGRVPEIIAGFDSLHVSGGRSREPLIRSAIEKLSFPVAFSATPEFPGQMSGHRFLQNHDSSSGWLCDLGQTTFKVSAANHRMQFQRDLVRLPIRRDGPDEFIPEQRSELRGWLAESLRSFSAKTAAPDAILFALPSRLDDRVVPEGSSYIGMAGDETLLADTISTAHLVPAHVWALNDAELAAMDALAEPMLQSCAKTLVITLGFGLGAALAIHNAEAQLRHA